MTKQLKPMPKPGPGEKPPQLFPDTQEPIEKVSALAGIDQVIEDTRRKLMEKHKGKGRRKA